MRERAVTLALPLSWSAAGTAYPTSAERLHRGNLPLKRDLGVSPQVYPVGIVVRGSP